MIKINLLPPNIFEARTIKRLVALFAVVVVAILAISLLFANKINAEARDLKQQADAAAVLLQKANDYKSKAAALRSGIAPIQSKVAFFKDVATYNESYPKLYEELAKYTKKEVVYSQLTPNGSSLTITAYAPSLKDAGRYLLNMYRASHVFSTVAISGVPGYPHQGGASAGGTGLGGMPGMVAPAPQMPGITGQQPGMSRLPAARYSGMNLPGFGAQFGMPGGTMGTIPAMPGTTYGGVEAISSGLGRTDEKQKGFNFTVTCTLKQPIFPPQVPGMGTQPMGGMGGMPGMPSMPGATPSMPGTGASAPPPPQPSAASADTDGEDKSLKLGGKNRGGEGLE